MDHARETGTKLSSYADPLEDARAGLAWDSDAVIERLRVDSGLVYLDIVPRVSEMACPDCGNPMQRDDMDLLGCPTCTTMAADKYNARQATCPMCATYEQTGLGISDDEFAAAESAGTICGQCAEVVAENRAALA